MAGPVRHISAVLAGLLLVVTSIWAIPAPAYACSCAYANDDPALLDRAEVIFTGTVIGERSLGYNRTYTFAVTKVYKGSAYAEQRVQSASQSSACGLDLVGSGPFLVLAGYAPSGTVLANSCGGTTKARRPGRARPGRARPGFAAATGGRTTEPARGDLACRGRSPGRHRRSPVPCRRRRSARSEG